ncbi:MAG TPA: GTP cyclohydrolase II [Hyphomicrobiales bacterium]|nr:GTP cyclohydrolase II [Hyphomicrobiales bacterium]
MKASVCRKTTARIPTRHGNFQLCYFSNTLDDKEHLAFCMGDVAATDQVLVRIHSECFTGDVLGSLRCDCGEQLQRSMAMVAAAGCGIILYMRQEGRGIGLLSKLQAYNLQDQGYDTVDANLMLGHGADERDYTLAARMLEDLGVRKIRLITNNPLKIHALEAEGIQVVERVPLAVPANAENAHYLLTKAQRMEHLLPQTSPQELNGRSHEPERTN